MGALYLKKGNYVKAAYVSGAIYWYQWTQAYDLNDMIFFTEVNQSSTFVTNYTLRQLSTDGAVIQSDQNSIILGVLDKPAMYYDNNGSTVVSYTVFDKRCP